MVKKNVVELKVKDVNPSFAIDALVSQRKMKEEAARKAVAKTYLKKLEETFGEGYHFLVRLSPKGDSLVALQGRTVVEKIKDEKREISVREMKKTRSDIEVGEVVYQKLPPIPFKGFPQGNDNLKISNLQITELG